MSSSRWAAVAAPPPAAPAAAAGGSCWRVALQAACLGCCARWWTMGTMMTRSCRRRCEVSPVPGFYVVPCDRPRAEVCALASTAAGS